MITGCTCEKPCFTLVHILFFFFTKYQVIYYYSVKKNIEPLLKQLSTSKNNENVNILKLQTFIDFHIYNISKIIKFIFLDFMVSMTGSCNMHGYSRRRYVTIYEDR